jgi:hypothetical protein
MQEFTDFLEPFAAEMDLYLEVGYWDAIHGDRRAKWARDAYIAVREEMGRKGFARVTTPGEANDKLDKASVYTMGLTIDSYVQRIYLSPKRYIILNACPKAGDCVAVCVVKNGNGGFPKVREAWRIRSTLLARDPGAFSYLVGFELGEAVRKRDRILFRPNVNSDIAWERLWPSLTSGALRGILSYGYSKRLEVLDTDGWVDEAYRVAYSWNEKSSFLAILPFLDRGGSVAMVTSRRKGDPPMETLSDIEVEYDVLDADKTDEWVFTEGAIGDLSAKGKARKLIGKSGFVVG